MPWPQNALQRLKAPRGWAHLSRLTCLKAARERSSKAKFTKSLDLFTECSVLLLLLFCSLLRISVIVWSRPVQSSVYSTLLYSTLLYSTLLYSTLLYSTPLLLYSALLCSALLYSYSTLYSLLLLYSPPPRAPRHLVFQTYDAACKRQLGQFVELFDVRPPISYPRRNVS